MKIICHGDSLTQGSDMAKPDTWTSLLGNHLGVPVVNTGISGDTTAGMLARFTVDVVPQKPNIAILMGGTNDLWYDLDVNLILAYRMLFLQAAIFFSRATSRGSSPMPHSISKVMSMPFSRESVSRGSNASSLEKLYSRYRLWSAAAFFTLAKSVKKR